MVDSNHIAASKQFTDRTDFIEAFDLAIENIKDDDTKVLTYYGIGGIGKTSLKKELQRRTDQADKGIKWVDIDFKIDEHRVLVNALIFMRTELSKKYKMRFPLFDFAYAYYLKKITPHIPLNTETIPFLEEGALLSEVILTIKELPIISIATTIGKVLDKSHKVYKDWGTQNRLNKIADMASMDANELNELLPICFTDDINSFVLDKSKKMIFFLDTYEALWDGSKSKSDQFATDEWIREVLVRKLPGVLFVILGREKLRWEESDDELGDEWNKYIEQHLIGSLDAKDAELFLRSCKINNDEIIKNIINISEGLPFSLDLCVDTYDAILTKNRNAVIEDFKFNNKRKIFERFMSHLDENVRETIKVLSITRFWNKEIFTELVKEYSTGYSTQKLYDLSNFSFISERIIKNTWEMNSMMRTSLKKCQREDQIQDIHDFLFKYYVKKLEQMDLNTLNQIYLNEAYYHGKNSMSLKEFSKWFIKSSKMYIKSGNVLFLANLFQDLYDEINISDDKTNIDSFAEVCYLLGEIYMDLGSYEKSEAILESNIVTNDLAAIARVKGLLANLQQITYKYELSNINYQKSIDMFEELELNSKNISNSVYKINRIINYGKSKVYINDNEEAIELYKKAIDELDNLLLGNEQRDTLLNLKAIALEKLGEVNSKMGQYVVTKSLYNEALIIYENINYNFNRNSEEEGSIIRLFNNKGLLYKRLAENYIKYEEFENAIVSYKKALEIYNESIRIFPENVDTYKKMGFASRGLLRVLVNNNIKVDEIDYVYNQTLEYFHTAIKFSPRDVAAIYSKGGVYRIMAKIYDKNLDYEKAMELQNMSIEQANIAIKIQPDYIYSYNGKSDSLVAKGDIFLSKNNIDKALLLYEESIETIDELIKRTPKDKKAIKRKEGIEEKIRKLTYI